MILPDTIPMEIRHFHLFGGGTGPSAGGLAIEDPRVAAWDDGRSHFKSGGHYGVIAWDATAGTVVGHAKHDRNPATVADVRTLQAFGAAPGQWSKAAPPLIVSLDGTWHRPLTTLELAALQGFPWSALGQCGGLHGLRADARQRGAAARGRCDRVGHGARLAGRLVGRAGGSREDRGVGAAAGDPHVGRPRGGVMERPHTIDGDTGAILRERWLTRPANQEDRVHRQVRAVGLKSATVTRREDGFEVRATAFEAGRIIITDAMLADPDFTPAEFERLLLTLAREGALIGA